jgi:hypothetical protein
VFLIRRWMTVLSLWIFSCAILACSFTADSSKLTKPMLSPMLTADTLTASPHLVTANTASFDSMPTKLKLTCAVTGLTQAASPPTAPTNFPPSPASAEFCAGTNFYYFVSDLAGLDVVEYYESRLNAQGCTTWFAYGEGAHLSFNCPTLSGSMASANWNDLGSTTGVTFGPPGPTWTPSPTIAGTY